MKKIFILFIGFSLLTSCGSDDNDNPVNASIVGHWKLTKLNNEMSIAEGLMQSIGEGKDYNASMTFTDQPNQVSSEGSVVLVQTVYMGGTPLTTDEELINLESSLFGTGQWELSGNTLTMSGQNSSVSVKVTKLTSNTLIFRYDPNETISITYQFSK